MLNYFLARKLNKEFPQKINSSQYLLGLMLMDSQMKFRSPQKNSGAIQENSVAVFSSAWGWVDSSLIFGWI